MNLSYHKEPFPYISGSLDQDVYNSVNKLWDNVNHETYSEAAGNRSNVLLEDAELYNKLSHFLFSCYEHLINDLVFSYPKLISEHEIPLKSKILHSENAATDHEYKIRGYHLDSGDKFLVGLWYFKHEDEPENLGGDLLLMNPLTKKSEKITYAPNTFVIFPNIPTAWHAVTNRKPSKFPRRYINLLLESPSITLHNYKRSGTSVDDEFRGKFINYYK